MLFNSLSFLFFFVAVFIAYWSVCRKKISHQNILLLVASYVFYGLWDWRFLSLIVISSLTDYIAGLEIGKRTSPSSRKAWLLLSLGVNLGMLGFFKYFDFFISSFRDLTIAIGLDVDIETLGIVLPVGISFYTFQTLSYTIDIYRGKISPTRNALSFFTFVAFFPQLVAGPIERASRLLPQMETLRRFSYPRAVSGSRLILWGMFKKVAIADQLGLLVNEVYADPAAFGFVGTSVAIVGFTFQIYCDFSGYSDIAIGTARLLGIDLMTNFRFPFFAKNQQDFWRRWHVSLSTWFKDYLYIPLGGSKHGKSRHFLAILITFFVSGVWHGANYTFLIWGFLTGLIFAIESVTFRHIKAPGILSRLVAVGSFAGLMILFRSPDMTTAGHIGAGFMDMQNLKLQCAEFLTTLVETLEGTAGSVPLLFTLILFFLLELRVGNKSSEDIFLFKSKAIRHGLYYVIFILTFVFALNYEPESFIYFQF